MLGRAGWRGARGAVRGRGAGQGGWVGGEWGAVEVTDAGLRQQPGVNLL